MQAEDRRTQWWGFSVTALVLTVAMALVTVAPAPAAATGGKDGGGKGKTVRTTINLPALVLDNLCNADVVNLSGDLHITTTTTPRRDGGYTVRSSAVARDLEGERIAPPPPIGYRGDDAEHTYSYYAPPPQPSTHRVVHYTRLIPDAAGEPTMYLVLVLRETVLADGTVVPVFERAYLVCDPRRRH